jgi:hypothetical protein
MNSESECDFLYILYKRFFTQVLMWLAMSSYSDCSTIMNNLTNTIITLGRLILFTKLVDALLFVRVSEGECISVLRNWKKICVINQIKLRLMNYVHYLADDLFLLIKSVKCLNRMRLFNSLLYFHWKLVIMTSVNLIDPNRVKKLK